ncbi:hypothetical protein SHT23_005616, partial [Escherichia coli]|nr:hypothetical protein [Escherichia coli]
KKKEWTNYSAVVFAKPGAQADYYRSVLVEGGIVEITGENIRVDVYQGQNGQSITLELLNAKIGFAASGNGPQQQSSNQQNTPVYDDSILF